ncbi:adenylate/guanylate cyclase domain-containing protein [Affinirhizobium pseudoryzae]|uniref:adenylate/guanylate cyclase domain-containing protein n=1 Tax=Allorhizobium pseudoryzae TaxID=379684 RepID=UPI0013E9E854|nr:adenylate/guanylate cyclase domain-containing protein [Allorhizobium pseudoryzae]
MTEASDLSDNPCQRAFAAARRFLIEDTHEQRYIDNLVVELCERLRADGVSIARCTLHFRINNPQWRGARILWRAGFAESDIELFEHGVEDSTSYQLSPMYEIMNGADEVRRKLLRPEDTLAYPILADLRAEGFTEYVAWPMLHTLGKRHIVTFASDAPGGFSEHEVEGLKSLVPLLSLVSEVRIKNILARTLLQTYVGPHAGEKILAGATRRGSGVTLSAVVMIFDVRDFTQISDLWPRDDVIEMLNQCFDALADPIESHGGEILKFMGDGLLAVFPMENGQAPAQAFDAILEVERAMADLNERRRESGQAQLGYGVGVHCGDVMYGNIGSKKRLDFTVIGPTVNIASRLEALTKTVHQPVLLSEAFVRSGGFEDRVERTGSFPLRGLSQTIDVYTPIVVLPQMPALDLAAGPAVDASAST